MRRGVALLLFLFAFPLHATIFGVVRGTVRDAGGAPLAGVRVTLSDAETARVQSAVTDVRGGFRFAAVPIGAYRVAAVGRQVAVDVVSGVTVEVTLDAAVSESMTVVAAEPVVSPTTQTAVARRDIAETPGAERSNSVAMITQFVPGSYVVHDQLHIRGGHQVGWLIDGVPVPNTNIASNVGPQFDPKDIDVLEVQRGGTSAEYGDRTYAIFNVVPRSGWDRDRDADVVGSWGSQRTTNDQFRIGDHSERLAWYASANGNRTDQGLETPIPRAIHAAANGLGALATIVALPNDADQIRFAGAWRRDHYDVPNDEESTADDREHESDAFLNASWVRQLSKSSLLTISPFVHQNVADFEGIAATDRRRSRYVGAQATFARDNFRAGAFGFAQRDDVLFRVGSLSERDRLRGTLGAVYAEDAIDATPWLILRGGVRLTHFAGSITENAVSPRLGATARLRSVVVRASYGHTYQAPPLSTVSGPLLDLVQQQGFDFLPLRGERDRQGEVGVTVPLGRFSADAAAFRTEARNFFDHDALGNSNIFFPLTIDRVHIRGIELALRSPQFHLAYSHQKVEGEGAVAGGLTDFAPPEEGRFLLDHDQRDTLTAGVTLRLPRASWIGANVNYGSGFLAGDGPDHLPAHTTFDAAVGTALKMWSVKLSATNVTNKRYLLDESNTFGGTHWADPRQVSLQLGYRFHY
ncbi:MAG TPA: TonB-dependent receptor [Thermoanaerobaculia bacterium]|nr:TonB-dependent receptor [Thermoanaerobaculia bacterium]